MNSFWNGAYARKINRNVIPRGKLARIARAEARVAEKAKLDGSKKPLDASRPLPVNFMWFALTVKSRNEFQVARWLEARGWFTVVPVKEVAKTLNGKRGGKHRKEITQTFAELSGFVFAGFAVYPSWIDLESCKSIYGPLATLGTPLVLSEREVTRFQQNAFLSALEGQERALMADNLTRIRKALEKGGKAKVKAGAFAGFEITVHSIKGSTARATINLFGGDTEAEFPLEQLDVA